tara:strand:- start:624 stop:1100 length:477 start_codon:yes stop_codon:yes gene_type:complete
MAFFGRDNEGYSRGGLDVESAVNLFFKGVLLFPVFLFAGYIGLAMMKHMIFHGIPSMTAPTQQQQERIHERNEQIGVRDVSPPVVQEPKSREELLIKSSPDLSDSLSEEEYHQQATEAYHRDLEIYQMAYRNWVSCVSNGGYCEFSGAKPSFANYYQL